VPALKACCIKASRWACGVCIERCKRVRQLRLRCRYLRTPTSSSRRSEESNSTRCACRDCDTNESLRRTLTRTWRQLRNRDDEMVGVHSAKPRFMPEWILHFTRVGSVLTGDRMPPARASSAADHSHDHDLDRSRARGRSARLPRHERRRPAQRLPQPLLTTRRARATPTSSASAAAAPKRERSSGPPQGASRAPPAPPAEGPSRRCATARSPTWTATARPSPSTGTRRRASTSWRKSDSCEVHAGTYRKPRRPVHV
jgi:hypothetical protein